MKVLKLCIVLLLGSAFASAADDCQIVLKGDGEPLLCFAVENGQSVAVDVDDCSKYSSCCVHGQGAAAACYAKAEPGAGKSAEAPDSVMKGFFSTVDDTVKKAKKEKAKVLSRFLQIGPPTGFPGCQPQIPFPSNCNPQRNEPYVLDPPNNVPYCVRIPCSHDDNAPLEKSQHLCGSQPGCYFDKELYEYREAFGQSVLPGVPVCHLAIRNSFFQKKSQEVVKQYGSWNPYFTNCLLNEYDEEIRAGPKGCELLSILDVFYIKPKLAGWRTITSRDCALIDGCYRRGQGCFYPVDIKTVVVKSGQQRHLIANKHEVVYGRPKCQHFDTSSPLNILKSYHQCLSSGCTVDSSVTSLYYNHLFTIGEGLSVKDHWEYWSGVQSGQFGADNIAETATKYGYVGRKTVPFEPPSETPLAPLPSSNPFADIFGNSPKPSSGFNLPPPRISGNSQACGHAFRQYNARPCAPVTVYPPNPNSYCPYKPFFVPKFPVLKGKFDGCCDINLCYLPRNEISQMHSGPSYYYSEWSIFSACSATCGAGEKRRYRKCVTNDKSRCAESLVEVRSCQETVCAKWGQWSGYSPCPNTCFPGGIQSRTRICSPSGGYCQGESEQVRTCNEHSCGFNTPKGTWTEWRQESCVYDRRSGKCEQSQTRYCTYRGIPGGKCVGPTTKTKKYACRGCHVIG